MRPFTRLLAAAIALAVIAACSEESGSGSEPVADFPAAGATITIYGWPLGTTGAVRLHRNRALLAEFPIDAGGRFTYALGVPDGLITLTPWDGITISPAGAGYQSIIVAMTLLAGDASPTGELHVANRLIHPQPVAGDTMSELFYVDRDVTISGSADGCTYDEDLRAGWNYVVVHVLATEPYACTITASPGLPVGLGWYYQYIGI
jgi:hypothetical protein